MTLETQKPKPRELQVIDVNRGKKPMDISETIAEVPTDVLSLSENMLKTAFGPKFDTEIGTPKEIR